MMLTTKRLMLLAVVAVSMVCCDAKSLPAAAFSKRPVIPNDPAADELSLQALFDGMTVSGPGIDAVNDQISNAWFSISGAGATAAVVARFAGLQHNEFGIYDVSNPQNAAVLFRPFAAPGAVATVELVAGGVTVSSEGSSTFYAGDYSTFGFWLDVVLGGSGRVYSDDDLNAGDPFALAYQGDNATTLEVPGLGSTVFASDMVLLGWEDWALGDDDYQDFVAAVQGVMSVPEPASGLVALSVATCATLLRRRRLFSHAPRSHVGVLRIGC